VKNFGTKQDGFVFVYVSAMLIVIMLSVIYAFNAGQISNEKTRLQNTADAVAYSVASVAARDLNFKAYTNRAMVANQVLVAQMMSTLSWLRMAETLIARVDTVDGWVPYPTNLVEQLRRSLGSLGEGIYQDIDILATQANEVNQTLSGSQILMHEAGVAIAWETFNAIVDENDSTINKRMLLTQVNEMDSFVDQLELLTQPYNLALEGESGNETLLNKEKIEQLRDVTMASRDGFTSRRTYDWYEDSTPCALGAVFKRAGGTELVGADETMPYFTWAAMDTLSMSLQTYEDCEPTQTVEIALASGVAQASSTEQMTGYQPSSELFGNSWQVNLNASADAVNRYEHDRSGDFTTVSAGLKQYYDFVKKGLIDEIAGVTVFLAKPHGEDALSTYKHTDFYAESSNLDIASEGDMIKSRIGAFSKAVPYFSRPNDVAYFSRRDASQREYGNLYNPFWQTRLDAIDDDKTELVGL